LSSVIKPCGFYQTLKPTFIQKIITNITKLKNTVKLRRNERQNILYRPTHCLLIDIDCRQLQDDSKNRCNLFASINQVRIKYIHIGRHQDIYYIHELNGQTEENDTDN